MSNLLQDLKLSLRFLAKAPGFTVGAVVVLALGIGLNTGMFTAIYGLALSPRPFTEPDRVVQIYTQDRKQPDSYSRNTTRQFLSCAQSLSSRSVSVRCSSREHC